MAKNATAMARSIKQPQASSTIANMDEKTTSSQVRAARPAALATGNDYTGQYLYERFVTGDKEEVSKMDVVRDMVKRLDVNAFKGILKDFVGVAKGYLDNAIDADKKAGTYNEAKPSPAVAAVAASYKTAKNHQTVMRIAYGALKFAAAQLEARGYMKTTGYQTMRVIGKLALADAGCNWDGTKAESPEVREARRQQDAETRAMLKVQENHPRKEGENRADYFARIDKMVDTQMKKDAADAKAEHIAAMVAKIKELAGTELPDILDALASAEQEGNNGALH